MKTLEIANDNKVYKPSKTLVKYVYNNMIKNDSINIFTNKSKLENINDEQVYTLIYRSVTGFIATISQGLAYGDGEHAILSQSGQLTQSVLDGFLIRIPVTQNIEVFSQLLYEDLLIAAKEQTVSSEFGKLVMKNNELIVERTKIIAAKDNTKIKRAEINRLG